MGQKSSRQQKQNVSSNDEKHYPVTARQYAKWDHQSPLTSLDITRVVPKEIDNLNKHHRTNSSSTEKLPEIQERSVTLSAQNYVQTRKISYEQNLSKPKLVMKKSRSAENLSDTKQFITAQQLLYSQIKQKQKDISSSSSQLSVGSNRNHHLEKSKSTTTVNQQSRKHNRKQIPENLKFVSINPKDLQNIREIGKGNFGTVYHAFYKGNRDVAIKSLHCQDDNSLQGTVNDDASMEALLHEAYIMTRLKHANLLRIIGVTFLGDKQQLSLVTDFMKNGSLLDYLRKNKEMFLRMDSRVITMKLNSFSRQIFEAMLYLEERHIIHRDLAARNCLIGENDTLKVGDFGLTTLTDCGLYKGTYRSICAPRWTSPEAVFLSKFSSRSDVWSYGITLLEIYSLGDRPFGSMTNFAVHTVLKNSSENISRYLPKPKQFASDETYTHIILPCLTHNVAMRPRFKDLRERLVLILNDRSQ